MGRKLDLAGAMSLNLVDEYLGIDVGLKFSQPSGLWTYPIETVSQSEGGFELVHQSVCVIPHWIVQGDAQGRWSVTMYLHVDTSLAESRMERRRWWTPTSMRQVAMTGTGGRVIGAGIHAVQSVSPEDLWTGSLCECISTAMMTPLAAR